MIKAEVEYDDQHGPIVTVRTAEETVSVYLCAETGVVTTEKGQYGLEVSGPWFKVRAVLCPEGGAYRDYLLRENRLLREELAEARKPDCTLCTHVTVNDSMNAFECGYNNTGAGTVCIGGDKFIKDHNDGPVRLYEKEGKV